MPELGTSGSVRGRDGQPPGLLDRDYYRKAYTKSVSNETVHQTNTTDTPLSRLKRIPEKGKRSAAGLISD